MPLIIHTGKLNTERTTVGEIDTRYVDFERLADDITHSDEIGIFAAETFQRYANQFVPMKTGMLSQNYIVEPWQVTYTQPYARRQFYGTGFNFTKTFHPNATARWDKATEQAFMGNIASEVQSFINSLL